jgi:hypothetical protein
MPSTIAGTDKAQVSAQAFLDALKSRCLLAQLGLAADRARRPTRHVKHVSRMPLFEANASATRNSSDALGTPAFDERRFNRPLILACLMHL